MTELRATRYLTKANEPLAKFITTRLRYLDYDETCRWYRRIVPLLDREGRALLGCNDRYFLLTGLLHRKDALHPWLFERCREVEDAPDGYIDLWGRFHFKSSIGTFAGLIQDILINPEVTIAIFSCTRKIAGPFLHQIQQEFESNDTLKDIYNDVLWESPRRQAPLWSVDKGIIVKRRGNPKEGTVEAHGLIDAQPTSRHFDILNYDDVITQDYVDNPDIVRKVTLRFELSDNLGKPAGTRKRIFGTRWSFADTYGIILKKGTFKPRIYPATEDGTLNGKLVFLNPERWVEIKNEQTSTVSAQMLLNPLAGSEAIFRTEWFQSYEVFPALLNVYIICDPSQGKRKTGSSSRSSDRTAIAVIGIDVGGNKYLLDGYCHRMKLTERYECLRQLHEKWSNHPGVQVTKVGYEKYGMQVDLEVIEEYQERDGRYFVVEELNFPREGLHSKNHRIERLEPDIRSGRFLFPGIAWNVQVNKIDGYCQWSVWTAAMDKEFRETPENIESTKKPPYDIGDIIYRPITGLTRVQRYHQVMGQGYMVVKAIRRFDEDRNVYDLTRMFFEEARLAPFAPHDDLIDAMARIYDMDPQKPVRFEAGATDPIGDGDYGNVPHDA